MSAESFIQMDQFYHFFQPIYDIKSSKKVGYEALFRHETYPNPEVAFQTAKQENCLYDLDSQSIYKALSSFYSVDSREELGVLFINIFPSTILNRNFPDFVQQIIADNDIVNQQVVLEISESEEIPDMENLKSRLFGLRQDGFLIAIDDVGRGYSSAETIIELEPDYLKLDRYLAQDLHIVQKKQEYISVFKNFCEKTGSKLILEGVETEEELQMAKALGISGAQGYYLGKPALLQSVLI